MTKPDMEMKLKWTQTCHVKADTINRLECASISPSSPPFRFVPTPGGVTIGADKFNPALDMVHRDDQDPNFPRWNLKNTVWSVELEFLPTGWTTISRARC